MHNRIDWCVRGYSHGFYNRGQDSAGLLMYEQSSSNTVAYNSVTHGGDGLFLWAGQSTMDTGQGRLERQSVSTQNDFSHAPTNGIEATFSRNTFIGNRVEDCWHGVWGGYSYDSSWVGNRFARNTEGIAIEHGQDNRIVANTFDGDETAIRLWQNPTQDPNWGYPKHRDTRSHGYLLERNRSRTTRPPSTFARQLGLKHSPTRSTVSGRVWQAIRVSTSKRSRSAHIISDDVLPSKLPGGIDPMIKDERAPRPRAESSSTSGGRTTGSRRSSGRPGRPDERPLPLARARTAGRRGRSHALSGASVSSKSGVVPGEMTRHARRHGLTPTSTVTLDYRGAARVVAAGVRIAGWDAVHVQLLAVLRADRLDGQVLRVSTTTAHPVKQPAAFATLACGRAAQDSVEQPARLHVRPRDRGGRARAIALPSSPKAPSICRQATTHLQVISDDGVRVWMDDA